MRLFVGLMSGTSMDGIDAALIDFDSNSMIAGLTRPYSTEARNYLNAVLDGSFKDLKAYSQLNSLLGKEFAQAALDVIAKAKVAASAIIAIGSHGQTLCHDANAEIPYTLQSGCAHTIADLTGITVVADFRTRDLIAGGQGAPFAPLYHQALFNDYIPPIAIVNIGGIANVTHLLADKKIRGYDLGPGNCLMDAWIEKEHGQSFDKDGRWAASGKVIESLLTQLLADPYFKRQDPKSIGKEYFSLAWLQNFLKADYVAADVQATLMMLTARTIAEGIKEAVSSPEQVFICGGGVHNQALMTALASLLPEIPVKSTAAVNINPDFIEALMFAWLAEKTLNYKPVDLSQITGSRHPVILGAIYPAGGIGQIK